MAINLACSHSVLSHIQRKFIDRELSSEISDAAFTAFDTTAYHPATLSLGRGAWQLRVLDEFRSYVAFSEFLVELTQASLPIDSLISTVRVVRDEMRHVELCRRMVVALGGTDLIPGQPDFVSSDKTLPLRERVLRTVVHSLCVGETISVKLLKAVRDAAEDRLACAVLTQLLADEAVHSQIGFSILELILPLLRREELWRMLETLPTTFSYVERVGAPSPSTEFRHHPFGSVPPAARADVFYPCVEKDVIRPLEALGIPARAAWKSRPRSS